jgi:ribosome maturation factor RimP
MWVWTSSFRFDSGIEWGCLVKLDPRIREIIERVTDREGLELVHAEMTGGRANAFLRIYIDKPGGVTHEDCARVSDQVGLILDVEDLIAHSYTLEVASPGLDRGLYKPGDYERFAGNPAHIKLTEPLAGQRNFRGTLIGLDREGGLAALVEDESGRRHRLPLDKIAKAHVELEP